MNNRVFAAFGLITGLLLISPNLHAAAATGADYEVEVVVFKNEMPELEGKEIWSPDRVDLTLPELDKAAKAADTNDEEGVLGKAVAALNEHASYTVLAHKRWTQTAEARSTSPLKRVYTEDGELDGTFVFYMSRFLHVEIKALLKDLEASEKLASAFEASKSGNDETSSGKKDGMAIDASNNPSVLAYRIDESRRIRSNEIHYFDHPKFGVLVKVSPVEK